jgi:orotidine-5'-phosphate decarboxylase
VREAGVREDARHDVHNPVCVALDESDPDRALALARATARSAGWFKVGLTAFACGGRALVAELAGTHPVFLDLKLHDIPEQVGRATAALAGMGAALATVHASAGGDAVRAAVDAAGGRLVVLGVTVLTSLDDAALHAIGLSGPPSSAVLRLADVALEAGAGGLVCSGHETEAVRARFGSVASGGPLLVVPGVRSAGSPPSDQRRTMTAAEAIRCGADIIVVGRPITAAADPGLAAELLLHEVSL